MRVRQTPEYREAMKRLLEKREKRRDDKAKRKELLAEQSLLPPLEIEAKVVEEE